MPLFAAVGTGIVRVIGLWNLRLRGSTVTIGETATLLPNSFDTTSGATGWACKKMLLESNLNQKNIIHDNVRDPFYNGPFMYD